MTNKMKKFFLPTSILYVKYQFLFALFGKN